MPKTFINTILGRPSRSYIPGTYVNPEDDPRNQVNPYAPTSPTSGSRRRQHSYLTENYPYASDDSPSFGHQPGLSRRSSGLHSPFTPETDTSSALGYARSDLGIGLPPGTSPYAPGRSGRRHSPGIPVPQHDPFTKAHSTLGFPYTPHSQQTHLRQVRLAAAPLHDYEYEVSPPLSNVSSVPPPRRPPLQHSVPLDACKAQPPTPGPTPPASTLGPKQSDNSHASGQPSVKKKKSVTITHVPIVTTAVSDDVSDSDNDEFYTPRSSFDFSQDGQLATTSGRDSSTPPSQVTVLPAVPTFQLQPPTPMNDRTISPLDRATRESSGQPLIISESEYPDAHPRQRARQTSLESIPVRHVEVKQPRTTPSKPFPASSGSPPPLPPKSPRRKTHELERRAHHAEMTILDDSSKPDSRSASPAYSVPLRRSKSASSKSVKGQRRLVGNVDDNPLPHSSSMGFRNSFSEVGTSSRPPMPISSAMSDVNPGRPDGGVRTAGYGKGGWAAASAAPLAMYMPSNGNDGWSAFRPLPPRSRFSVLPGGTRVLLVEPEYDRKPSYGSSSATSSLAPSASASQDGRYRHSPPSRSPTMASSSQQRKYDQNSLSRSSSLYAASLPPHGIQRLSPVPSPQSTASPTPAESDDEWEGEKPSRSYLPNTAAAPAAPVAPAVLDQKSSPRRSYDYNSDLAGSNNNSRRPSHHYDAPMSRTGSSTRSNRHSSMSHGGHAEPFRLPHMTQMPIDQSLNALRAVSPPLSVAASHQNLDGPSSINPDLLTFLPEMTAEASNRLYTESDSGHRSRPDGVKRSRSLKNLARGATSDVGTKSSPPIEDDRRTVTSVRTNATRISLDRRSQRQGTIGPGDMISESHCREYPRGNGYTTLVMPQADTYALTPKQLKERYDPRPMSMPRTSMAAITLTSSSLATRERHESPTPLHLRYNIPAPVDFTSHMSPPSKIHDSQVMVQVYAVGVDAFDTRALDHKGLAEVGKWVPGRSFVGRCVMVGSDESVIQRGDLVMGLLDIKKSGALCEYIAVDRRRVARLPHADLSLEQLALLPTQGITATRALRGMVAHGASALVMDAHEGIPALMCQELSRQGVFVTAIIPGGDDTAQARAMAHGARGVLVGSPAAVMLAMEEGIFHLIVDTRGGSKVVEAAKRAIVEGGRILSLAQPDQPRRSNSLRNMVKRNRVITTVTIAGTGEAEVDPAGLDPRDVMEERAVEYLKPVVGTVLPFERGAAAFNTPGGAVVRIIN